MSRQVRQIVHVCKEHKKVKKMLKWLAEVRGTKRQLRVPPPDDASGHASRHGDRGDARKQPVVPVLIFATRFRPSSRLRTCCRRRTPRKEKQKNKNENDNTSKGGEKPWDATLLLFFFLEQSFGAVAARQVASGGAGGDIFGLPRRGGNVGGGDAEADGGAVAGSSS